jgi:hypothetical protein
VLNCVCSFSCSFIFHILVIFINLSNKQDIINMKSKELNSTTKDFQNNIRSIVISCFNGISTKIYRSYWYNSSFLWGIFRKLQDLGVGLRRKSQNPIHGG